MSKRKQNTIALKRENLINRLRILLIAALTIITFYPPYLQGLYFEKHVLPTQIIVFVTFIVFLIYKLLKKDYTFFRTPIDYACLGFVIVYFISIFVAVHTRSAIIEWLKYCMYFAVFYMISDLADNQKTKLLFLWTIIISAFGVSVIGLDAAFGGNFVRTLNKFFNQLGVKGDLFFGLYSNNRIHSTLQYANALASYLMAVFFVTVGLLMFYNKLWQKAILGAISYILFLTFMLTQSRGAQVLFPVVVIILFILMQKRRKINSVTHVILLALPAAIISLFITSYLSHNNTNKATFWIILGLVLTVFLSVIVKYIGSILQKIDWKIYVLILVVIVIATGIAISYVISSSVPVELSLMDSGENRTVSVSKDIALKPNKDYILRFEAEGKMLDEKPYSFFVRIYSKNMSNILFGGSKQLLRQNIAKTDGFDEFEIPFSTEDDTELINANFAIYYSGTGVTIKKALVIDAETGKTVKNIVLKNKYNLDRIISRFQNILLKKSLVSRIIFYKDGIRIFFDNWFLGAGGGAWSYLYRQYQSYNYNSNQAHNYPLQVGIETGIIGLINLAYLVIIIIVLFTKYYKKRSNDQIFVFVFTAIAALLMHSVIDFDFSESSMIMLFWSLIALFNRELIEILSLEDFKLLRIKINNKFTIANRKVKVYIGIAISIITLYFSSIFFVASTYAWKSFVSLQDNNIDTAINMMEKAIKFDRFNEKYVLGYNPIANRPDIKVGLINILFIKNDIYERAQKRGEQIPDLDLYQFQKQLSNVDLYIRKIEKKAKNNLFLTTDLANYYFNTGEIDKGLEFLDLAISYYPFEPSLWHVKIDVYYQLMATYFNNKDYEKAEDYLGKGLNVINEAKNINEKNLNPFLFNAESVELLQKMKYLKDNWIIKESCDVNSIIHYSICDLDVNNDGIPDQWKSGNTELINVATDGSNLLITSYGRTYLYTNYPIMIEQGKTYQIEVKTKDDLQYLTYYIPGIMSKAMSFTREDGNYKAELLVENNPDSNGNQLRLYIESDCVIESIIVKEKNGI